MSLFAVYLALCLMPVAINVRDERNRKAVESKI
jgi:hypothetical protein